MKIPDELKEEIEKRQANMSETEKLKMNTQVQSALERAEEIHKFLKVRLMMREDMKKWSFRLLIVSLLCIGMAVFMDVQGLPIASLVFNGLWLLLFIAHLIFENMKSKADGELTGALKMMEILGHLEDVDCDCDNCKGKGRKKSKAKSMFARPKEFFERIGKSKEAYGT